MDQYTAFIFNENSWYWPNKEHDVNQKKFTGISYKCIEVDRVNNLVTYAGWNCNQPLKLNRSQFGYVEEWENCMRERTLIDGFDSLNGVRSI